MWVRTLNIMSGNRGLLGHCQAEGARGEQKVSSPFILSADGGKGGCQTVITSPLDLLPLENISF